MKTCNGITSVSQWQFSAALLLYVMAILFFAETRGQGQFRWSQLTISACIAFVIVTSLCWQWRFFGDPRQMANFMLHLAFLVCGMFFINHLFAKPIIPGADVFNSPHVSVFDGVVNILEVLSKKIISWIPPVIFEALRSPGIAILFVMTTLALSFRRRIAISLLMVSLFIAVIFCMTSSTATQNWFWFFSGVACMGTALYLQADNPDKRRFSSTVIARLEGDPVLRADMELKIRLLRRLYEHQKPLTQIECLGVISRALGVEITSDQAIAAARRIAAQLVNQDQLARYAEGKKGKSLCLNMDAFRQNEPDIFATIAIMPKTVMFVIVAFLWIISPIDLIPDSIPVFGAMDDVVVGTLGFNTILQCITGIRMIKTRDKHDLFSDDLPV